MKVVVLLFSFLAPSFGAGPRPEIPLPIDQVLTPEGVQFALPGVRPKAIALSPDGRLLVASGTNNRLYVFDPGRGTLLQTVPLLGEKAQVSFTGLVFAPDGRHLYLADFDGTIRVFAVGADGTVSNLRAFGLPPAHAPRRSEEIPSGLALSADGRRLYVGGNLSNGLWELDAATGAVLRRFEVGVAPYDVVLCGGKAYVSNWGGRRPEPTSPIGPAGRGTVVRVDPVRSAASEGSVSIVDLASGRVVAELLTGRHASGLACSPDGRHVVVANANEDTVSVIDARTDRVVETISLRWHPQDLFGATPNALTFDRTGRTLFVCNGTENAVAVISFRPGQSRFRGLIPVGWFPAALAYDAKRNLLVVANEKGEGRQGWRETKAGGFNSHEYIGSVSFVPLPGTSRLKILTAQALANYRREVMAAAALPARPGEPARPVPQRAGEPSVFRHVIYIIKENRSFDQVLGDMGEGNGDPDLCIFGEPVTPNLHRLARDFALLDNTYCAGVLSADGHMWATTGIATDYVEKSFWAFPRSYPYGGWTDGVDAMAYAPTGFIWDNARAHGVTVRNYGEFMLPHVRWTDPQQKGVPAYADIWADYLHRTGRVSIACSPGVTTLGPVSKVDTIGWDLDVSDQYRADRFIAELRQFEKSGDLPRLIVLYLPQDHAHGTVPGVPTPAACLADNDLAVGRVVEALSHSRFWADTCLFAFEDDPQNGWDHVSGYRTTAYVVSAYTRRHVTVSARFTQPGLLRTIELILGRPPMNQMDASALPWGECFTAAPDLTPYTAVANRVPLDQLNPPLSALTDPILRRDAVVSAHLPFAEADQCPEDVLNRILWRAQRGSRAPYPQWAVLADPGDDD
jgi:YVTN family beta-propeller protein